MELLVLRGSILANTFQHKLIHRYTWARGDMSIIDYIAVDMSLQQDVVDAKVERNVYE